MSYKLLNKEIKNNQIRNIYLFYGPEKYLVNYYLKQIKNKVFNKDFQDMNYLVLEEESATVQAIIEFCDSFPIMSEKKLLIVKNIDFLTKSSKSNSKELERLINYLSQIPNYIHIIFVVDEVNKKNKLYKFLDKNGLIIEFEIQTKSQLIKWVGKIFKENDKSIGYDEAKYLIDVLELDMQNIMNECFKLISYVDEKKNITYEDIDNVCSKSTSYKVFEMVDDIAQKDTQEALKKLNEILNLKEPEVKILGLIVWNIKILLKVKLFLKEGLPKNIISKKIGISFVNKFIQQSENFSISQLEIALNKCSEADVEMKSRSLDNKLILEQLIIQIAQKNS